MKRLQQRHQIKRPKKKRRAKSVSRREDNFIMTPMTQSVIQIVGEEGLIRLSATVLELDPVKFVRRFRELPPEADPGATPNAIVSMMEIVCAADPRTLNSSDMLAEVLMEAGTELMMRAKKFGIEPVVDEMRIRHEPARSMPREELISKIRESLVAFKFKDAEQIERLPPALAISDWNEAMLRELLRPE